MSAHLFERKFVPAFGTKSETIDIKARTIVGVATTTKNDRDNEIVETKAFAERLDTFKKNPVFLWMHNPFEVPIGKVLDIKLGDNQMEAVFQFRPEGDSPLSDNVWNAFKGGFLTSFSIGFRTFKVDEPRENGGPLRITDAELFEISAVTIPANTDAIVKCADMVKTLQGSLFSQGGPVTLYSAPTTLDVLKRCTQLTKRERKDFSADELTALDELQLAAMCATASTAQTTKALEDLKQALAGLRE